MRQGSVNLDYFEYFKISWKENYGLQTKDFSHFFQEISRCLTKILISKGAEDFTLKKTNLRFPKRMKFWNLIVILTEQKYIPAYGSSLSSRKRGKQIKVLEIIPNSIKQSKKEHNFLQTCVKIQFHVMYHT